MNGCLEVLYRFAGLRYNRGATVSKFTGAFSFLCRLLNIRRDFCDGLGHLMHGCRNLLGLCLLLAEGFLRLVGDLRCPAWRRPEHLPAESSIRVSTSIQVRLLRFTFTFILPSCKSSSV